jgi:arginyl-tRNA synthetase
VLDQEPGVTAARLTLVRASKTVIANGLRLLGPAALDEM